MRAFVGLQHQKRSCICFKGIFLKSHVDVSDCTFAGGLGWAGVTVI